jgi:hypothetical protein
MNQRRDVQKRVWIRDRDSSGNLVDQALIEAAHRVWERARLAVIRFLADDAEAPELLESAVDSASRVLASRRSIRSLDSYLLRSVAREAIRRQQRNRRVVYTKAADLERVAEPVCLDLDRKLDDAKRIDVFRACMDQHGRALYDLRVLELDWKYIARMLGYADAHSAEVQFHKKMAKALERFRAYHQARLKRQHNE